MLDQREKSGGYAMNLKTLRTKRSQNSFRCLIAVTAALLILPGNALSLARRVPSAASIPQGDQQAKIPSDQIDSLVAPIALYPDNLLSQTLVASTYPLEIVQLQQWLEKNPNLSKDQKKLADSVKQQPWDPSIQAMAPLPDVVKRLSDDIQWTTDLGNAFLAHPTHAFEGKRYGSVG